MRGHANILRWPYRRFQNFVRSDQWRWAIFFYSTCDGSPLAKGAGHRTLPQVEQSPPRRIINVAAGQLGHCGTLPELTFVSATVHWAAELSPAQRPSCDTL
jgi:hypothetical protein